MKPIRVKMTKKNTYIHAYIAFNAQNPWEIIAKYIFLFLLYTVPDNG